MDTIVIRDLEVHYHVGVPDEERAQAQRLLLTVEMGRDFAQATATDNLEYTINYFAVSQRLLALGDGRSWRLIETLAEEIARILRREFGAKDISVEVRKFIIPEARYVAVKIHRT